MCKGEWNEGRRFVLGTYLGMELLLDSSDIEEK